MIITDHDLAQTSYISNSILNVQCFPMQNNTSIYMSCQNLGTFLFIYLFDVQNSEVENNVHIIIIHLH